eukprot:Hpha_TRINITY_DN22308_c0_g1::TRINITY_DN22308_c0_g1_i1::g.177716::m.177716
MSAKQSVYDRILADCRSKTNSHNAAQVLAGKIYRGGKVDQEAWDRVKRQSSRPGAITGFLRKKVPFTTAQIKEVAAAAVTGALAACVAACVTLPVDSARNAACGACVVIATIAQSLWARRDATQRVREVALVTRACGVAALDEALSALLPVT